MTFNGQAQIVRDFSPTETFTWVPHTVEGTYQFSVVVRDTTTMPYVLFAPVSCDFICALGHRSAGRGGRQSDRPPSGRFVQRAAMCGGPSAACPLSTGDLIGFDDHQPGAVLDKQRELLYRGHVSVDPIPDALGGVRRDHLSEHGQPICRSRPARFRPTSRRQKFHGQCAAHRRTTRPIQWSCFRLRRIPSRDRPLRECDLVFPQPAPATVVIARMEPGGKFYSIPLRERFSSEYDLAGNRSCKPTLR